MKNLREAGFRATKAAKRGNMSIALGTLASGELVLVAKTLAGEGYTTYHTAHEASRAFNTIVSQAMLEVLA